MAIFTMAMLTLAIPTMAILSYTYELPAACQAATVAAVERVAARAICELVALLPAAAAPPPAAAHALLRAAQTAQAASASNTDVSAGLQLRYCAALRQLAWRHRAARQPAPPGVPTEALLVAALRVATAAATRGGRGGDEGEGEGGRQASKPARRGGAAAAAAAMEAAAAAVQLQALALQAIAAWLEHGWPWHIELQPEPPTVAARATYGCSMCHVRLQPVPPTVAGDRGVARARGA